MEFQTIEQLNEEIDEIGRIKEKYDLKEEVTKLPNLFSKLEQTQAIIKMIDELRNKGYSGDGLMILKTKLKGNNKQS